ncbi:MAG: hypothetical protein ACRBBR_01595 [Cellvibrionaceae bacterium]
MEAQEIIEDLRNQLKLLKKQNQKKINITSLNNYLDIIEKDKTLSNEHQNRELNKTLAAESSDTQWGLELFRATIESGKTALNSIIIVNGGAIIVIMSVIANLVGNQDGQQLARHLAESLKFLSIGVLAGSIGLGFRYFSQACYTKAHYKSSSAHDKYGDRLLFITIIIGCIGIGVFINAIFLSYNAFSLAFKP